MNSKRSAWNGVEVTGPEMIKLIQALRANDMTTRHFTGLEIIKMIAIRRAVKAGYYTDEVKAS